VLFFCETCCKRSHGMAFLKSETPTKFDLAELVCGRWVDRVVGFGTVPVWCGSAAKIAPLRRRMYKVVG
jgi:hypothetical protein